MRRLLVLLIAPWVALLAGLVVGIGTAWWVLRQAWKDA